MPHQTGPPVLQRQNKALHDLSILNEHPSLLEGPDLLHHLVAPPSTATAIDFLEHGSKRREFSYKTLHSLSNSLAQKITESLQRLENVSTVIPVLLPQCPELYIVLLAILKAGKAFCPLSLDAPAERLEFILNDISADLLITDSFHGQALHLKRDMATLYVDQDAFQGTRYLDPQSEVSTNNVAYVLYTSGSTGLPKAVSVSHRAVTQSLLAHDRHIPHFTRFLQFAAPTFDVFIFEIFFPWYRGGTLTSRTRSLMLENLPESIRLLEADAAELTPTVVSNLLEGRSSVPGLRLLLTIGEMLKPDVVEEYGSSATQNGILWAMYGPTEAAIHCTLQPRMPSVASTQLIGVPLDTVSVFIAASTCAEGSPWTLSILPRGEEGELVIGGYQIADEYINRPELTRASFIHHPQFGTLYRTGDRARIRSDGMLECLGRVIKGQVKLRGQRVELSEIEQVAIKAKGCRAATVSIVDDVLVAFCATGHHEVARAEILALCKQWLPAFMVPGEIVVLSRMPQLPSGKIDEAALVAMYRQSMQETNAKEEEDHRTGSHPVLGLLQKHFKRSLPPESELTAVGCDSLQAIRLASVLRSKGYGLTALDILSAVTVRDILQLTDVAQSSNGHTAPLDDDIGQRLQLDIPELASLRSKIFDILPCTPIQEAMLAETTARGDAYCNWVELELPSSSSFEKIKKALQELARRNAILRSGFCAPNTHAGAFVQVVWHALDDSHFHDVRDFSRKFALDSADLLSRPLSFQVCTRLGKPRLLLQIHHALYDGWSLDLVIQDLADLLADKQLNDRPQFREIVRYHMDRDHFARVSDSEYWAELLRDHPNVSLANLNGCDVQKATTRCFSGRSSVDLGNLLNQSRELMVSPQVWFQAALTYITALYTGSHDTIIGNVTSGRTIPVTGVEDIIGPCIASLPFRLRMGDMISVRDILNETQRQNRKSLEHCSLPLREIAKLANVHNGTCLFDVLFVWQQPVNPAPPSSVTTRIIDSSDDLEFRVTLEFEPRSDHISFRATFDSSTIPEQHMILLSQQIDDVVQWFLHNVDRRTTDIATCFSKEALSVANPTPLPYSIEHGPAHAVEKWASETPHRAAVFFFQRVNGAMMLNDIATYATLNSRANQMARALKHEGVRQGCIVAIIMEKSLQLYIAILAVLKLGAGYLPLVPDLPESRMRTILSEARVAVCMGDSSSPSHLQQVSSLTLLNLDTMDFNIHANNNVDVAYDGANIAYAVFTSGSTGVPKGVLVTQDNLMSNLRYLSTVYPFKSTSRLLQSCSQAFDVSVFEIFFSWHVGMCLCTAVKDDLFSDLEGAINQLGITHLSLTPTVAALVDPDNVPKVEFLVTAGEAVTEHVRRKWAGRGLYQGYGPSETTNICTVRSSVSPSDLINNIGRPFENTSSFVFDPTSTTILPRGAVGELCFGGQQVFRGYLNRPDLTTEKVIQHPEYGRIYRSGDLGLLLYDNSILFVGRLDDQVKVRGQRVELGEVNSAVLDEKCTLDCSTLLLQGAQESKTLVTFWVPSSISNSSSGLLEVQTYRRDIVAIFAALSARLPSYMIPSHCVPIESLPITAQGKIDKRFLQQYFDGLSDKQKEYATRSYGEDGDDEDSSSPLTDWQHRVARILASLLDLPTERIQQTSTFFSFGLDSISAIGFSNSLRKGGLGDFTISEIMKNPTLQHLTHLGETRTEASAASKPPTSSLEPTFRAQERERVKNVFKERGTAITKIRPCTPLQQAMLSSGHSGTSNSYSNVMLFTIKGDLELLQACWRMILERHEIFRTAFVATDDPSQPFVQVVLDELDLQWHKFCDLEEARQSANDGLIHHLQANKPPIWLATISSNHSTRLLFGCHHAMYDGIAMQRLLEEVQIVYHRNELPAPISFDVYLQQMLALDFAKVDHFWTATLHDYEPTAFPSLTATVSNDSATPSSYQCSLQLPLSKIRETCQSWSVTLLPVIHATWSKLLHFYTAESDICFGTVVNGRARPGYDLNRLVAPCFNTLPVRPKFDFGKANINLVHQAHAYNVDSLDYQLTPLRRIQANVLKDGGRLFDTLVILQQPSESLDGTIWSLEEDDGTMDLPLVCEISQNEAKNRLDLIIHYHRSILSEAEAAILAKTFDTSLTAMIEHPYAPAEDVIGLAPALRSESCSAERNSVSTTQFLHSGFEANVRSTPDKIALDFLHTGGTRSVWSYRRMNEEANNIARALIGLGVQPEDIVPVHMYKCPMFYASILGILKAGAAFSPIHPDLPGARRKLMIEDLNAKFVLYTGSAPALDIAHDLEFVDVDELQATDNIHPLVVELNPTNIAYCIFTSGSTGEPKAVSVEHHAPIETIESSRSLVPWNQQSRLLQFAAITFDMCYYDCFLAWTLGFTLCSAEQDLMLNELPTTINTLNSDLLDLTPSVASSLTRAAVPGVKWLYCIGEAMTQQIVKEWKGACVNSYGPSEAAFCTTIFPVSKDVKPSIIGKPFPSTSFAIFSGNGHHPLPLLSIGELYIGGAQLARGYHGRPQLTEEKFMRRNGQRFYRSGDVVRMLSDGNFEFVGRFDDQVKIRGQRVELSEIDHTIEAAHPAIATAVTRILKKDVKAKDQLVAFLVVNNDKDNIDEEDFRRVVTRALKGRLPSYMVPQFLLFVDQIPRSMAGKVDQKALTHIFGNSPEASAMANGLSRHHAEHRWTRLESQVREIFAHLSSSSLQDVFPTTTIYQLGMDSISAVQIASALRREGRRVNASDVMNHPTCLDLAACLDQHVTEVEEQPVRFDFDAFDRKHREHVLASCNLSDADIATMRPCTPLQRGMLSQMLASEGAAYINYLRLELKQGTDIDHLRRAWQKVVTVHPILRTGFVHLKVKEHPFGMIEYSSASTELPWDIESEHLEPEAWLQNVQRGSANGLHRPLWRLRIVNDGHTINLDMAIFHALFDAQSLQTILRNVVDAYHGQEFEHVKTIEGTIDGILDRSQAYGEDGKVFWAEMGQRATPHRFPILAPLRYDPQPPEVRMYRSNKLLSDIEKACRQSNTSLQAAGIAAWVSLLAAYTGESSATCGVVLSGRSFEEAEDAVFPCINTIPFAHTMSTESSDMLASITSLIAEAQQHQHVPLNDIQRMMGYPTEALFDTIFAYQKLPTNNNQHDLWRIVDEKATTEYPISIELEPSGEHLDYRLTFMPHLIPAEQADIILRQLDHLVQSFILPQEHIDKTEKTIYSVTPAKEPTLPSEAQLLHDFVEITAKEHPQRIAFEFADEIHEDHISAKHWTCSQLNEEGNRVANMLIDSGVQPGDLVGVCFEKCPEASFAMLGVLKAGAAFVAIDPGAPAARQTFVIQDSGASAVLSMSSQSVRFAADVKVPILDLDKTKTRSFPSSKPVLPRNISPKDRSYCLYTSGTTGTPKGCELTHENAVQALLSFQRLFAGHWDADSRWLQFASFHFDVSVLEQYWSWSVGICVVSAPRDVIFEDLAKSISTLRITHVDLTPSLAQLLHPDDVPMLCKGVFITGGESLKQEILDVWGSKGVIYNGYGPTEATIGCTMYPRVPSNGKPSNIGPQFDNVGTLVLRPGTDEPVLRGGVGELCVSGKLVGKGYLNRPDLTEKSFPYLSRFQERVYRTGDLVRILYNGSFEFLGRADDQVKLRGQRLEIGEINSVIRQSNKNFSDVATLVLKHPRQQKEQLVSFIVHTPENGSSGISIGSASELRGAKDACHDKLPPYMVPTHFMPLKALPLNVNNKADVKKLKEMYESLSATELQKLSMGSSDHEQPWSHQELAIRKVLSEELNAEQGAIGKNTSLFELGMDSISAIGVTRALKQAGLSGITASIVMKNSTISRLAKAASANTANGSDRASLLAAQQAITALQHRHRRTAAQSLSVDIADIEALAPCTPLQEGMIARSLESEDGLYFNSFCFELADNVDELRLEEAWRSVFTSTQILRTIFVETEDGFVQAALHHTSLPWKVKREDVISMYDTIASLKKEWLATNADNFSRPFELILLHSPGKKVLIAHILHALYDGISIELVFNALWNTYRGHTINDSSPSFLASLAYGPLRIVDGAREFWKDHLQNHAASPHILSPSSSNTTSVSITRNLCGLEQLETTRRNLKVTAQAIVQACWMSMFQEHFGATTTVGVVVSGRSIEFEGADRINGPMFNTIPYSHWPQPSESWTSIIQRVHKFNVAAHPYQHTPLREIHKWCGIDRSQPLFDHLFVYQVSQGQKEWAENEIWRLKDGESVADYPLALEVEQQPSDTWRLTLVCQEHVLNEATADELLHRFEVALRQAVDEPETVFKTSVKLQHTNERQQQSIMPRSPAVDTSNFEWTDETSTIRKLLAEMTNVELGDIGESTSIFELGLDSIDAIKLSSRLKKQGIQLPVSGIMQGLTISKMLSNISNTNSVATSGNDGGSELLSRKRQLKSHVERRDINTKQIDEVLPLTPLQEAMMAEMVTSQFMRYFNFDVMKLEHGIDVERLRLAWTQVVAASPILRTSFIEVADSGIDDSFAQIVHSQPHDFWSRTTTATDKPDFTSLFDELRAHAKRADQQEPPFYVWIVESPNQTYLILSIAHALYDGWSLGLLHADVKSAYEGRFVSRPDSQQALSSILATTGPDAKSFWADYLYDDLPSNFPRASNASQSTNVVHRLEQRSKARLTNLMEFAKRSNISVQTMGQTAFSIVLASYVHSLDVSFGSVLSGRDDETLSKLLFPTMNTIAFRAILHGTALELLRHVQDNFLSVKRWQHFPLRKALAAARAHGGLFESLFIYQKTIETDDESDTILYTSVEGRSEVEYAVCVEMEVVHDQLTWRCAVQDEVFSRKGAKELLHRLDEVLLYMMQWPEKSVIDYTAHGISLCGLPSFNITAKENPPIAASADVEYLQNDEPRPETLGAVRQVMANVSGTPEDEITDDMTIFHIGLDSISAIKVTTLLRHRGIKLSVGNMLRAGTIMNIARAADVHSPEDQESENDGLGALHTGLNELNFDKILRRANAQGYDIDDMDEVEVLPATAGQIYMISMWLNTKGVNFYPEFGYALGGAISFEHLQTAWKSLVAANPLLRTCFVATDSPQVPYVQLVRQTEEDAHPVLEVAGGVQEDHNAITKQPWACLRASRSDSGWRLKLKLHHALYDGVSLPLLMQQLQDLCNGIVVAPQNTALKALVGKFTAPAAREQRQLFWSEYLANADQSHLTQPSLSRMTRTEIFRQNALPTDSISGTARKSGVSVQALFLAAYARIFTKLTGTPEERDIVLGVYLANRSLPVDGIETAAIPTVNLLPLRVRAPIEQSLMDVAQQIQDDLQKIGEMPNANASLFEISEWTRIKVDTFVNFLTLPDARDSEGKQNAGADLTITTTTGWNREVSRIVEAETVVKPGHDQIMEELRHAKVNEPYLHAIDIEATMRNGALDLGIFAPEEMLDLPTGEKLLEDLKTELMSVSI